MKPNIEDIPPPDSDAALLRSRAVLVLMVLLYVVILVAKCGEFWPFGGYQTFSNAGNPWSRLQVQDVSDVTTDDLWQVVPYDALPGRAVPLVDLGFTQSRNELSALVETTTTWNPERVALLRTLVAGRVDPDRSLMLYRVVGQLEKDPENGPAISVVATPIVHISADSISVDER